MNKKSNIAIVIALIALAILGIGGIIFGINYLNNKPFRLEEKYYGNMSIVNIDHKRYEELVDKKENFILYLYLDGCTSCQAFKPVVNNFVIKNKLTIYSIEYKELNQTNLKDDVEYAPSMIIMKKGKLKAFLDAQSDDDLKYYRDYEELKKWFEKYIEL